MAILRLFSSICFSAEWLQPKMRLSLDYSYCKIPQKNCKNSTKNISPSIALWVIQVNFPTNGVYKFLFIICFAQMDDLVEYSTKTFIEIEISQENSVPFIQFFQNKHVKKFSGTLPCHSVLPKKRNFLLHMTHTKKIVFTQNNLSLHKKKIVFTKKISIFTQKNTVFKNQCTPKKTHAS